jgi:hypothetical protein
MRRETVLKHEFVEYIPDDLMDGTIYVSMAYATVAHKCCCGCGNEVITPLSPTDWRLIFDGESISLHPSIGNWNFACQSHYWIKRNKVKWARRWSQEEINAGRAYDSLAKERYYDSAKTPAAHDTIASVIGPGEGQPKGSLWRMLKKWLF